MAFYDDEPAYGLPAMDDQLRDDSTALRESVKTPDEIIYDANVTGWLKYLGVSTAQGVEAIGMAVGSAYKDPVNQQQAKPQPPSIVDRVLHPVDPRMSKLLFASTMSFADTVATSLLPDALWDEQQMEELMAKYGGDFGAYFNRNRMAAGAVGDTVGLFLPATLGIKAVRYAPVIAEKIAAKLGPRAADLYMSLSQKIGPPSFNMTNQKLLAQYKRDAQLFVRETKGLATSTNSNLVVASNLRASGSKALNRKLGDTLNEALGAEALIYATMAESDFLFPDEMSASELLRLAALNVLIPASVSGLGMRLDRNIIFNKTLMAERAKQNPTGDLINTAVNIVDERGVGLALQGSVLHDVKSIGAKAFEQGDMDLDSAANAASLSIELQLTDTAKRMFADTPIIGYSEKTPLGNSNPAVRNVVEHTVANPANVVDAKSFEVFSHDKAAAWHETHMKLVNKLDTDIGKLSQKLKSKKTSDAEKPKLAADLSQLAAQREKLIKTQATVLEIDNSISPATDRPRIYQDSQRDVIYDSEVARVNAGGTTFHVDNTGQILEGKRGEPVFNLEGEHNVGLKKWLGLSHYDRTALYDGLQLQLEKMSDKAFDWTKWEGTSVGATTPFWRYDFLLEMVSRNVTKQDEILNKINGISSLEDLQFKAASAKFDAYQGIMNRVNKLKSDPVEAAGLSKYMEEYASIYLKRDSLLQVLNIDKNTPQLLDVFASLYTPTAGRVSLESTGVLSRQHIDSLVKTLNKVPTDKAINDVTKPGSMLNMPRHREPVIMLSRQDKPDGIRGREDIIARNAAMKAWSHDQLLKAKDNIVIGPLVQLMDKLEPIISDGVTQLRGLIHGAQIENSVTRKITTRAFQHRENHGVANLDKAVGMVQQHAIQLVKQNVYGAKANHNPSMTRQQILDDFSTNASAGDIATFNAARNMLVAGWNIDTKTPMTTIKGPNGSTLYQINVKVDERNKALVNRFWPDKKLTDDPDAKTMPLLDVSTNQPVTLTERAKNLWLTTYEIDSVLLDQYNAVRVSSGLKPIDHRFGHVQPFALHKKHRAIFLDKDGKVATVIGDATEPGLSKLVEKTKLERPEWRHITEEQAQAHGALWGEVLFRAEDFGNPLHQSAAATGKTVSPIVDISRDSVTEMLLGQLRHFNDLSRHVLRQRFGGEIKWLNAQRVAAVGEKSTEMTVFDDVANILSGRPSLEKGLQHRVWESVADGYNLVFQTAFDAVRHNPIGDAIDTARRTKAYDSTKELLAVHNPWKSVQEFLEKTNDPSVPVDLIKHGSVFNRVTASVVIMTLDTSMALLNLMSGAVVAPIVGALNKVRRGEIQGSPDHLRRIGAMGGAWTEKTGAYFDGTRLLEHGVGMRFTDEGERILREAVDYGTAQATIIENVDLYASLGKSKMAANYDKYFAKWAEWPTRRSEQEIHNMAYLAFYKAGRDGLGMEGPAAHLFAWKNTQNTIADFRPSNKPQVFQGAFGVPLGLFSSYMWNYFQRTLQVIENRNTRAGALTAGLQAAMFGAESVPGYSWYVEKVMANYDGSDTLSDRLDKAVGNPLITDLIQNGFLGNIPRLFGADTGFSMGPRAKLGMPFSSGLSANSIISVNMAGRVGDMLGEMYKTWKLDIDNPYVYAEIFASRFPMRFASNAVELAMGHSVDKKLEVVEPDTRTPMGVVARVFGSKPIVYDSIRQEQWRNTQTEMRQQELMTRLTRTLESAVFNQGGYKEKNVERGLKLYTLAGGNPEKFGDLLLAIQRRATTDTTYELIEESLRGSIDRGQVGRALYIDSQQ